MKRMLFVVLVLVGIFAGCTHTEKTATGGAVVGAAVGALLGNDARSTAIGAGIGGALGAGAGEMTKDK
ncbi:YMGG-like glycine zipper-containing protein [Fusobacterium necrophorum]|uniref:YMGG-like Gly-zipper domain-containing protein n=2 Tax=Fusobacterium necrophorum subsp. funduliforme TaxID=143387 RepID=A0A170MXC6_9FUSO|nr:YMGG-like glycine zipper-containing protein [Fusobacterium necrophorum]EHO20291.1 hypothetical protein HMPREF9466_01050 [Fusobacterium necrophorum subsp. funduliforme 1_1_36S]EIJ73029.1 putative lipoprotein [Fusobacterium necrophorum subsp. funduliforme ATCC 51357]EYD68640.1 hypothetical protein FNF_08878 [Fusobacterium necrophorum subsp. funduliforme B35]KAB0552355.1 hypothetical protein F7P76_08335 [Fusobacterium necrophorum subsp. funduliforme]KID48118.1 hypothetical protein C095_12010 [